MPTVALSVLRTGLEPRSGMTWIEPSTHQRYEPSLNSRRGWKSLSLLLKGLHQKMRSDL